VRGVVIHGIGKMSLVTSSWSASDGGGAAMGKRRTFLGIREVDDVSRSRQVVDPDEINEEEDYYGDDEDELLDDRRRLLHATIDNLLSRSEDQDAPNTIDESNKPVGSEARDDIITQIREEVVDLYSSHFINGVVQGLNDEGMEEALASDGWTRLQSVGEDFYDAGDDDRISDDIDDNVYDDADDETSSVGEDFYDAGDDDRISDDIDENVYDDGGDDTSDNIIYSHTPSQRKLNAERYGNDDFGDFAGGNDDDARADSGHTFLSNSSNAKNSSVNASSSFGIAIDGSNGAWRRSTLTLSGVDERSAPTRYVYPYPYVIDDAEDSIKKASSSASRRIPSREQISQANAANCEFEINMDIQEIRWTYGEWRTSMEHRLRMGGFFNPNGIIAQSKVVKWKRSQYLVMVKSQLDFLEKQIPKEALVMTMVGTIDSNNCDFQSFVNVTAMRTNWEHTTSKAINYSFYMMLTCLTQIVILLRQLLHTQSQSVASNVSLLCIGWQALLDAILCISHIFLCLVMQPLFTAFASVAFFKLLIFCVIEMKYMAIIIHARNTANNAGFTQEDLRRQITLLHLKFYGALMFSILAFWHFGQTNRSLYILVLYSFWVPQIVLNVITESRKPLHPYYLYGMSLTRSVAPLYVFAVRNNFLKEVNPDFPTETRMCEILILWIGLQTAILFAQGKYGTRFMIPQR